MQRTCVSPATRSRKRSTTVLTTSPAHPATISIRDCTHHTCLFDQIPLSLTSLMLPSYLSKVSCRSFCDMSKELSWCCMSISHHGRSRKAAEITQDPCAVPPRHSIRHHGS